MCIRKFFDDFIKDNPTLENNDLVVRKDNKKYIVKINKDGMFDYKEVEEKWVEITKEEFYSLKEVNNNEL